VPGVLQHRRHGHVPGVFDGHVLAKCDSRHIVPMVAGARAASAGAQPTRGPIGLETPRIDSLETSA
jgi:hypothetical protein